MQSVNFEFIRDKRPYLADLGGFAEHYLVPDPQSALLKMRLLVEKVVDDIYIDLGIDAPEGSNLFERMNDASFRESMAPVVYSKLHLLRTLGNQAAHGKGGNGEMASRALREAYQLLCWVHMTLDRGSCKQLGDYRCPSSAKPNPEQASPADAMAIRPPGQSRQAAARGSSRILATEERELNHALKVLKETLGKAKPTRKSKDERKRILLLGESVANELNFSEAETRKFLVDTMLATAGWDVGPNGKETDQVGQEVKVLHQDTKSGEGFADYVLWGDNGSPLAVVEVKKTAKEPSLGRRQAQGYADGLEKEHGCRPVIFYTNGFDLWIWNDHKDVDEPDRLLRGGFYSKDSLEYLHSQRSKAKDLLDPEAFKAAMEIAVASRISASRILHVLLSVAHSASDCK